MKKKQFVGITLIVIGLFVGCVKDLHNAGISDATILKGKVLEESEREPLVNVRVIVTNGATDYASAKTNEYGKFALTVNYNNLEGENYLFLNAGSSGITKRIELKGMGLEAYDYGDIFLYNKNDGATPTISTSAVRDITATGAVCGGNITSDGGSEVTNRGLCWNTSANPDISNSNISCGLGTGEFTGSITSLIPNTRYYVRAYATNSIGTAYGEQREFTTTDGRGDATKPTVSTNSVSNITFNSAKCGGNITSDGGSSVIERGICWAKATSTHSPTISNYTAQASGAGTGSFSCTMTGLSTNTDYYVRAYAKNAVGISYGDTIQFTTLSGGSHSAPSVITGNYSNLTSHSATCRFDITSDGGAGIVSSGVCYSTSPYPTWDGSGCVFANASGTGTFFCDLINLSHNTRYYYRAFAINQVDISYGDDMWFITLENILDLPDVFTYTVSYNASNNTATCTGFILSEGSASVTACGFCWGTSQDVEIGNNPNVAYSSGANSSGIFTCTISNFSPSTTYYVRAFATNGYGTGYGLPKQIVTSSGGN